MKYKLLVLMTVLPMLLIGQTLVSTPEYEYDMGKISVDQGPVSHTFILDINVSEILEVKSSSPTIITERKADPSNENATILIVTFTPKNPGTFRKTITIILSNGNERKIRLKGEVLPAPTPTTSW